MELCEYCGENEKGVPFYEDSPACGDCHKTFKRMRKHEKRAIQNGLATMPFTFQEIFERDGGICWICFEPVNLLSTYEDDMLSYASLDHVIALKSDHPHNPGHVPTNTQLAHFLCNSKKQNNTGLNTTVYCCKGFYKENVHDARCSSQNAQRVAKRKVNLDRYIPFDTTVVEVTVSNITPTHGMYDADYVEKDADGIGSYTYYEITFSDGTAATMRRPELDNRIKTGAW